MAPSENAEANNTLNKLVVRLAALLLVRAPTAAALGTRSIRLSYACRLGMAGMAWAETALPGDHAPLLRRALRRLSPARLRRAYGMALPTGGVAG